MCKYYLIMMMRVFYLKKKKKKKETAQEWQRTVQVPKYKTANNFMQLELCSAVGAEHVFSGKTSSTEDDGSDGDESTVTSAGNSLRPPWDWAREVTLHLHICSNLGASLVTQMVENPPAMHKTLIQSLGQEDPLEKGMATHSSILGLSWQLSW